MTTQDETNPDEANPLATHFGTLYPTGYAVAAVADGDAARVAAEALQQGGWAAADVTVLSGQDLLAQQAQQVAQQNPLQRLAGFFASDEARNVEQYRDLARQGAWFIFVKAANDAEATRVGAVLQPYDPLAMHHYGENTTADILQPGTPREREP